MRRMRPRLRHGRDRRGQSLVEFALVVPVMLLLVLFGIDFGRIFLGWVQLNNVVREAANIAAENPTAWNTVNPNTAVQTQYANLITNESAGINCTLPATMPTPSFPNGRNGPNPIGSPVTVRLSCTFAFITPVIGSMFGGSLPVAASASYPNRSGMIANIPTPTPPPSASPSDSASPSASASAAPSASASASPAPTPSPTPCVKPVPNLMTYKAVDAQSHWSAAGFTIPVMFNPMAPAVWPNGGGNIVGQTPIAGVDAACDTTIMTVTWK